jgi:DNA-binding response OmpR family regulator
MKHSVLVVDDDPVLLSLIRHLVEAAGYTCISARTADEARRSAERRPPDVALVDLKLGSEDGLDLVRLWRVEQRFPVLIVSSRGDAIDRVVGLEVGAQDYVVKPFEPRELQLRIRIALERRSGMVGSAICPRAWQIGESVFDGARRAIKAGSREVALTTAEYRLIDLMVRHPNQVLSRDRIMDAVQQRVRHFASDRSVDMLIARLRRKLADFSISIQAIRGTGYMLCGAVESVG